MAGILGEVVQEFKSILSHMEEAVKDVLKRIATYSEDAEKRMVIIVTAVFRTIKKEISDIIQKIKDRIESLKKKHMSTSVGSSASLPERLKNGLSDAAKEGEKLVADFKNEAEMFIKECRNVIKDVTGSVEKTVVDTASVTRKAGEDLFHALDTLGKDAFSKVEKLSSYVSKHIALDAEFAFHHGIQVAEAATIAIVSPVLVGSVAISGLMLIASAKWEPG